MGKYEPLGQFLKKQKTDRISMTFKEIEHILKAKLPPSSKHHRAWWSNNPNNNVMTREWLAAGFETEAVDIQRGELVFRKQRTVSEKSDDRGNRAWKDLYGCMKGMISFAPDFDPTAPAFSDHEWEAIEREGDERWKEMMRR